jgi:hypothetical protein
MSPDKTIRCPECGGPHPASECDSEEPDQHVASQRPAPPPAEDATVEALLRKFVDVFASDPVAAPPGAPGGRTLEEVRAEADSGDEYAAAVLRSMESCIRVALAHLRAQGWRSPEAAAEEGRKAWEAGRDAAARHLQEHFKATFDAAHNRSTLGIATGLLSALEYIRALAPEGRQP